MVYNTIYSKMEDPNLDQLRCCNCQLIASKAVAPTHQRSLARCTFNQAAKLWIGLRLITMVLSHFGHDLSFGKGGISPPQRPIHLQEDSDEFTNTFLILYQHARPGLTEAIIWQKIDNANFIIILNLRLLTIVFFIFCSINTFQVALS